jgi:hypothetical protein
MKTKNILLFTILWFLGLDAALTAQNLYDDWVYPAHPKEFWEGNRD